MTTPEACELIVDLVRQFSEARRETAAYRLLAHVAIAHAAEVTRENEMIDRRRSIYQRRTAEQRANAMVRRQDEAAA